MRIAFVINKSWNIYNFRLGLVKAFLKEGFEVYAIAPEDEYSRLLVEEGCKFIPLFMEEKGSNPFQDTALCFQLFKIYKKIKPDAVLHYTIKPNIYGTIAARLLKITTINNVSGLGTVFLHNNYTSKVAQFLYKFSFRYPTKVFFQNNDDLQLFLDKKLVPPSITGLLPGSGINLSAFTPREYSRNSPFVFLVIARLLYDKGIVEFVEAARALKNRGLKARFQILGYTDFNSKLGIPLQLLEDWKREEIVEYLGVTNDVKSFIYKADCIVLPSYREGTPRTLLEAASLGKPLIATDVPGCREVVQHEYNGYLCQAKNADDLSEKMGDMFNQTDDKLIFFGKNSRTKVETQFNEEIVFHKYFQALNIKAQYLKQNQTIHELY